MMAIARCIIPWPKDDSVEDAQPQLADATPSLYFDDVNHSDGKRKTLCRFHPRCLKCCGKSTKQLSFSLLNFVRFLQRTT